MVTATVLVAITTVFGATECRMLLKCGFRSFSFGFLDSKNAHEGCFPRVHFGTFFPLSGENAICE